MCIWSGTGIALEVTHIRRSGGGCLLVMDWRIGSQNRKRNNQLYELLGKIQIVKERNYVCQYQIKDICVDMIKQIILLVLG